MYLLHKHKCLSKHYSHHLSDKHTILPTFIMTAAREMEVKVCANHCSVLSAAVAANELCYCQHVLQVVVKLFHIYNYHLIIVDPDETTNKHW